MRNAALLFVLLALPFDVAAQAIETSDVEYYNPTPTRRSTTHALFVGGRFDPGAAWLAGYDLEIELNTPCGFNLGPSLSVAFGGGDGGAGRQDLLASLDFLRGRFLLDEHDCGSCGYRLQALLGAGMYFALNPAVALPIEVENANGELSWVTQRSPEQWQLGAQITGGMSADWWFSRELGVTGLLAVHVRLDDYGRMPALWAEAGLGVRFGT
jgi:hypothetical protein